MRKSIWKIFIDSIFSKILWLLVGMETVLAKALEEHYLLLSKTKVRDKSIVQKNFVEVHP